MSSDASSGDAPSDDAPNWSLLPHRPIEFFGLAKGFERSDLKRAYNKLLRTYKPDKFPEEFQRLRAAYEQLDTALRYGSPQSVVDPELQSQWLAQADAGLPPIQPKQPSETSLPSEPSKPIERPSAPNVSAPALSPLEQLLARLDETSPGELYRELESKTSRSPLDYYALALLSDSVHPSHEPVFVNWILAGLKKFSNEPALLRLLGHYLQTDQIADASLEDVLVGVSKVITTDRFFFFTERLFDRLTRVASWADFERVFETCRLNINDHQVRGQVVFSCHLLRRAAWLAPEEKTQELVDYIEAHAQYLGTGLEYDYEFNTRLIAYVKNRKTFAERGPNCKLIDDALRAYCLEPGDVSDRQVVACQSRLAQQPELLFREFPYPAEDHDARVAPWVWACDEVLGRLETESDPPSVAQRHAVTLKLLKHIDATFPSSSLQLYNFTRWFVYALGYAFAAFLPLFFVAPVTVFIGRGLESLIMSATMLVIILLAVVFHLRLKPRMLDPWFNNRLQRLVCRHYNNWWRSTIARFHAATHLSYHDVRQASIDLVQYQHAELNVSTWFPQLYGGDVAMVLYASALRFLR